ncbi:MAG: caspase family protein [Lacibacter sp.]
MRKIALLAVFAFISQCLFAQSLFEFRYYFGDKKDKEEYKAFLLRNEDGTGFIRVRYIDPDTKKPVLVDMDMEEQYGYDDKGKPDTNLLLFEGKNPLIIIGDAKEKYDPDIFWFSKNEQTGFFEPWAVISPDEEANTHSEGVIEEMRLLDEKDLTQDFMMEYFTPDDEVYKTLFVNKTKTPPIPSQTANFFLIVVANTSDKSIGTTVIKDKAKVIENYAQVAKLLNLKFHNTSLSGNEFSKANVEAAINNLKPGLNDIVVFYYSGHGFNDKGSKSRFPFMDLRTDPLKEYPTVGVNALNIENVYRQIVAKGARLNIVISDCCNADIGSSSTSAAQVNVTRPSTLGPNLNSYISLFLDNKPFSILMTAAAQGELSGGNDNDGGIFTNNFLISFDKFTGKFFEKTPTWEDIIQLAQKQTISRATISTCEQPDGSYQKCKQTPVYEIKPGR